jgi:excisionase family DNA binding protein
MSDKPRPLLTVDDLAEYLAVSRWQVYRLVQRGLPVVRVGERLRFRREDVDAFIERGGEPKKDR